MLQRQGERKGGGEREPGSEGARERESEGERERGRERMRECCEERMLRGENRDRWTEIDGLRWHSLLL
eukprot:2495376-Rhodomonas_salina.5